ncbi:hypothetical protein [Stenomitos frigidus]|nr:hypothetical protein [Stenomitos frigidus]
MQLAPSRAFPSVQEGDDPFLALWPHRYDYLWAEHPHPDERPDWQTESRHPLSDRLLQQGTMLYGVRFGPTTRYCVLDVDKGSAYHPTRDRFAWRRLVAALDDLGLVQAVVCTSSYSGGLHLYFPFDTEQKTWAIALAVSTLLENAGFKLAPGQLEVFPNCKAYVTSGEHSLYNGHRLPMQAGSYLLNQDLQMIWGNQETFVQHWQFAQQRNSLDTKAMDRILKAARRRQFRVTGKADKFLNDLNAEIEQGWTGPGQTNRLLGRIAMRSYIFGHVLYSDKPLEGNALSRDIVTTAQALPGYADWCQHQQEVEKRAQDWMHAIEQSHYFHYGTDKPPVALSPDQPDEQAPNWNQQQEAAARDRIQQAIANLLEQAALPTGITKRFDALVTYGLSGTTLYRHRDLWHPRYLQNATSGALQSAVEPDCSWAASGSTSHTNLLGENGCKTLPEASSNPLERLELGAIGCNSLPLGDLSQTETRNMTQEEGIAYIKQVLNQVKARRQVETARKRQCLAGQDQLSLPFDQATP